MAMSDTTRPDGEPEDDYPEGEGREDAPFAEEEARENAAEVPENPELELGDEDTRLPWLEGEDDEEHYEGYNSGQVIGLVLLGLLAIGVIVGGIWWATRSDRDETLIADGGTIEAPAEAYKAKPEDPGGKTFEGTGDTSFAVSEGETREARLGQETPKPGFDTLEPNAAEKDAAEKQEAAPASGGSAEAAAGSGVGVQVGAYSTREAAEAGWRQLSRQYGALDGMKYRIVEGQADIGKVFRLQALPGDGAAAKALCSSLKSSGLSCYVKN